MQYSKSSNFQNNFPGKIDSVIASESTKWPAAFTTDFADLEMVSKCKEWVVNLHEKNINLLIIIGMGGSSLGGKALESYASLTSPSNRKLFFLEGPHPGKVHEALRINENAALLWVSKSGSTLESLTNLSILLQGNKIPDDIAIVTSQPDKVKSTLPEILLKNPIFIIPENLGGRFSIVSAVGIIPGFFLGLDMGQFMQGFNKAVQQFSQKVSFDQNPAKKIASDYYHSLAKKQGVVFWVYSEELFGWAFWLQQLWGESLGKRPGVTALPYVCRGPEDQHSMLQFFLEGPDEYLHSFIIAENFGNKDLEVKSEIPGIHNNHSVHDIINSQMKSIVLAMVE